MDRLKLKNEKKKVIVISYLNLYNYDIGMVPDEHFGKVPTSSKHISDHAVYEDNNGGHRCMGCSHSQAKTKPRKDANQPEFSGRRMARGDEWRYSNLKKSGNKSMRTNMISKEAPDFITRLGSTVSSNDFGHQHPYKEGSHTERLRNASVQKGCGKKCTWQRTASSHNSPLSFDDSSTSKSNSKSVYGQPYAGSGRNGGLSNPNNNQNKNRNKSGNNNDNRPETAPPFAVSVLQHPNDFNKSSTKHQLGKQVTNRFYNTTGGWSASRA